MGHNHLANHALSEPPNVKHSPGTLLGCLELSHRSLAWNRCRAATKLVA